MTSYALRKGSPAKTRSDLVVIGVGRTTKGDLAPAPGGEEVGAAYGRRFAPLLKAMSFRGEPGEALCVPTSGTLKAGQLLLVGVGALEELTGEGLRRAAGVAARNVGNAATVSVALPATDAAQVRAVVEGFLSGSYRFRGRRSKKPEDEGVGEVSFLSDVARTEAARGALDRALVTAELIGRVRDWVNTPPNDLTPAAFADSVVALHKERAGRRDGLEIEVLGPEQLEELGCGGVLAVGGGSANGPRLVKLTWTPADPQATVALVGKGITYDSGGLTIKPGSSMATMKYDMAGAATVLAATFAIAALELPVAVACYAPMAENMPSGSAMRPGDVITMYDGQTVEITNTDAEGRLILADALAMAVEQKPDAVLDAATLTGPCVVALGDKIAGLFGDDATTAAVTRAAESSGELLWRLPLPEQTRKAVREETRIADVLQHNWVRWGSALFAAAFLECFVGEVPWAHLDIAGPAWNDHGPWGHVPSGATGYGVTTLVDFVAAMAEVSG